jgi:hypothetical protein
VNPLVIKPNECILHALALNAPRPLSNHKFLRGLLRMDFETIKTCLDQAKWVDHATLVATVAAVIAAVSACLSYRLSKNIYDEIKSDETVIAGRLHHPGLQVADHDQCVLRCTLLNKSHRKAFISSVMAFGKDGKEIPITWSSSIDSIGTVLNPTGLLGLENNVDLVLRRNDGEEFKESTVHIKHSFSDQLLELKFDPYYGWS